MMALIYLLKEIWEQSEVNRFWGKRNPNRMVQVSMENIKGTCEYTVQFHAINQTTTLWYVNGVTKLQTL